MIKTTKDYKKDYEVHYENAHNAYERSDMKEWVVESRASIESMCKWRIAAACGNDLNKANDILIGKRDFKNIFDQPLERPPYGGKLISILYQIKRPLGVISNKRLYNAYKTLSDWVHNLPSLKIKDIAPVKDLLDKINKIIFFEDDRKTNAQTTSLEKTLKECAKISKNCHKEAWKYLTKMKEAIDASDSIINGSINDLNRLQLREQELMNNINQQLKTIKDSFINSYIECTYKIDEKYKQIENFNITLFGATTVGKSTLREILTNGDGKSIGEGAQRTTTDVKKYKWQGMSITDVPGIEAYDGDNDAKLAKATADYADMVIFMIQNGQPTSQEADWLVELKKKDKPILCVLNYHQSLLDPMNMDIFLENPSDYLQGQDVEDIKKQFNEFVQEKLPDYHLDILAVHLQARFMANMPEYADKKNELIAGSQFANLENEIVNIVRENGEFYRRKSFLSIIDIAVYEQMKELLKFSSDSYHCFNLSYENRQKFENWKKEFIPDSYEMLRSKISDFFEPIKRYIPIFIDENLENDNFNSKWNDYFKKKNVNHFLSDLAERKATECRNRINEFFADLQTEINISYDFKFQQEGEKFVNGKRAWGWASAITGTGGAVILLLGLSNPIGWAVTALGMVFGLFSWFCDPRETKLRNAKHKIRQEMEYEINKSKQKAIGATKKWFYENVEKGMIAEAGKRFSALGISMKTLTNSQRELADRYVKLHTDLSKHFLIVIMQELGYSEDDLKNIIKVARIPAKRTLIVTANKNLMIRKTIKDKISSLLGTKERIDVCSLNTKMEKEIRAKQLLCYLGIRYNVQLKQELGIDYAYLPKGSFEHHADELDLAQQLLNVYFLEK